MPDSLNQQQNVAAVYAGALYDLARQSGQEQQVQLELDELARLFRMDAGFRQFLSSRSLHSEQRRNGLERMLRGRLSDFTLNTLLVMNEKDRGDLVEALCEAYATCMRDALGEIEGTVHSAVPLDQAQRQEVERTAAELSGRKPVLRFEVDAGIIGGLILQIGDIRYDYSLRHQLQVAHERLTLRAERGLRVGVEG